MFGGAETTTSNTQTALSVEPPGEGCHCGFGDGDDGNDKHKNEHVLDDAEKTLSADLLRLSFKEREDILHDVHGVMDEVIEGPELVANSIQNLEVELYKLQRTYRPLAEAMQEAMAYVQSLYMMFLRADGFRVKDAAQRFARFFDCKQDLFGREKLCKTITLADFNKHDMKCFEYGFFQQAPARDRSGRAILCNVLYKQQYKEPINCLRVIWYLHMTALLDEETQKKGIVVVIYNVTPNWSDGMDNELYAGVGRVKISTPIRSPCVHYCFSDPTFGALIKFVTSTMERDTRVRTRLHRGTHLETQYALMSFGIPTKMLPVNSDGTLKRSSHLKWLKSRMAIEKRVVINPNLQQIVVPSLSDVLFGRGTPLRSHLGNMKLTYMIERDLVAYFSVSKKADKAKIANVIIKEIKDEGGRFLKQSSDLVWEEVDDNVAFGKVGHGFRNRKPTTTIPTQSSSSKPTSTLGVTKAATKRSKQDLKTAVPATTTTTQEETVVKLNDYMIGSKRMKFDNDMPRSASPSVISESSLGQGSENNTDKPTEQPPSEYLTIQQVHLDRSLFHRVSSDLPSENEKFDLLWEPLAALKSNSNNEIDILGLDPFNSHSQ